MTHERDQTSQKKEKRSPERQTSSRGAGKKKMLEGRGGGGKNRGDHW